MLRFFTTPIVKRLFNYRCSMKKNIKNRAFYYRYSKMHIVKRSVTASMTYYGKTKPKYFADEANKNCKTPVYSKTQFILFNI